jgi:hypothetical protein
MSGRVALVAAGTVVAGAAVVGAAAVVLHSAPKAPPLLKATVTGTATTTSGQVQTATLDLNTYPDSAAITWRRTNGGVGAQPDWVSYGPTTNLQVPANAVITVTIHQYDGGEAIPNPFLAQVHGTVGGTATIDGKTVTGIDANHVGHTFTIHSFPNPQQDPLFVSVPLPAVAENAPIVPGTAYPAPHVITFQFVTHGPGTYAWNCEFPCGGRYAGMGDAMSTYGYMSGTLHVVASS